MQDSCIKVLYLLINYNIIYHVTPVTELFGHLFHVNTFQVTIHLPSKIPEIPDNHFALPLDQRVTGVIIPRVINTSKAVKKFDVSKRDCYFASERPLYFFKIYTQENCVIECKTNYTLAHCGCVGFHMPSELIVLISVAFSHNLF